MFAMIKRLNPQVGAIGIVLLAAACSDLATSPVASTPNATSVSRSADVASAGGPASPSLVPSVLKQVDLCGLISLTEIKELFRPRYGATKPTCQITNVNAATWDTGVGNGGLDLYVSSPDRRDCDVNRVNDFNDAIPLTVGPYPAVNSGSVALLVCTPIATVQYKVTPVLDKPEPDFLAFAARWTPIIENQIR
jgi:hypothetical protein